MTAPRKVPTVDLKYVRKAIAGRVPDIRRIVNSVFHQIGGEDEFAKILVDELQHSKPNGMVRARILDLMLQMMKSVAAKEAPKQDLGLVSEQDIEADLMKRITHLAVTMPMAPMIEQQPETEALEEADGLAG